MGPPTPSFHRSGGRILPTLTEQKGSLAPFSGTITERWTDLGQRSCRLDLPDQIGDGAYVFHKLDSGFYLLITNMRLNTAYATRVVGENLIEFHYRLSNRLELKGGWGEVEVTDAKLLLWYQPDGHDDVFETISEGARDVSVSLYCSPDWIGRAFAQGETLPAIIRSIVEGGVDDLCYRLLPHSPRALPVLEALVQSTGSGLSPLRAHGRALELLCLSLAALENEKPAAAARLRLTERDLANVARAHAILKAEFANPPPLDRLARRVGLNTAKLPCGFKRQYGVTIQEFVRRRRLERALELLESTDQPIGLVAAQVGYSHHSTFTAAFADHFGYPPKSVAGRRHSV